MLRQAPHHLIACHGGLALRCAALHCTALARCRALDAGSPAQRTRTRTRTCIRERSRTHAEHINAPRRETRGRCRVERSRRHEGCGKSRLAGVVASSRQSGRAEPDRRRRSVLALDWPSSRRAMRCAATLQRALRSEPPCPRLASGGCWRACCELDNDDDRTMADPRPHSLHAMCGGNATALPTPPIRLAPCRIPRARALHASPVAGAASASAAASA